MSIQVRDGKLLTRKFYRFLCYCCVFVHIVVSLSILAQLHFTEIPIPVKMGWALTVINLATQFIILGALLVTRKSPPE